VTYGLAQRHQPELLAGVRSLGETLPSPTLPFITHAAASSADIEALRGALADAIADPVLADAVQALGLLGVAPATAADYAIIARYERDATEAGYPVLA
jgi:ABC-type phosphate/phosphonate transport system substrate-binding protein